MKNPRISSNPSREAVDFFYRHSGRMRWARLLAEAEEFSRKQSWVAIWKPSEDEIGEWSVTLVDGDDVLVSVAGVTSGDSIGRRIVNAELALEAMSENPPTTAADHWRPKGAYGSLASAKQAALSVNPAKRASSAGPPRISTTFEIVTPESAELGDAEERGWIDEEGYDMTPRPGKGETVVDNAIAYLERYYASEASSTHFHPGVRYTAYKYDEDFSTGAVENRSYHLDGFTEAQEREIFDSITKRRRNSSTKEEEAKRVKRGRVRPPGVRLNPSGEFQAGAAKAFWADLYMTEVEELADEYPELYDELSPGPGGEWMDYVPEPPRAALNDARAFERAVVKANGMPLSMLVAVAARADGMRPEDIDVEDFGWGVAMPALGHGVSWFDDHSDFDLKLPHWEQSVETHNAMYDLLEVLRGE